MWVDILLAIVALSGVLYGIAGDPRKSGKLTAVGKGIIGVAAIALVLSIIKSIGDEQDRAKTTSSLESVKSELTRSKTNTDRIPGLVAQIEALKNNAESIRTSTAQAAADTAKLRSAILAIFEDIRVENDQLIVNIPDSIVVKNTAPFGPRTQRIPVDKNKLTKEVKSFQHNMDGLEKDLLAKVERVESLFRRISDTPKSGTIKP